MSLKKTTILLFSSLVILSCNKGSENNIAKKKKNGGPCNITVELEGKAPEVQFLLYSKAQDRTVNIDRQVNLLDDEPDTFSISSYHGGKIECSLKTTDSFGPKVKLKIFVNGKFWQEAEGSYNPEITGEIPDVF